jgi:hypothetical protein
MACGKNRPSGKPPALLAGGVAIEGQQRQALAWIITRAAAGTYDSRSAVLPENHIRA